MAVDSRMTSYLAGRLLVNYWSCQGHRQGQRIIRAWAPHNFVVRDKTLRQFSCITKVEVNIVLVCNASHNSLCLITRTHAHTHTHTHTHTYTLTHTHHRNHPHKGQSRGNRFTRRLCWRNSVGMDGILFVLRVNVGHCHSRQRQMAGQFSHFHNFLCFLLLFFV